MTGLEAAIGARYTFDTVAYLKAHCPGVDFVWIMGADNLRSFHRWENWRGIAAMVPIAVVDRLGPSLYAAGGHAGQALARYPHPGDGGPVAARPQAAGLGLPARAEIAAVVDRAARRPAPVAKPPLKMIKIGALRYVQVVETINPACLSLGCADIGAVKLQ